LIIKGYVIATSGKLRSKIGPLDADLNNVNFGKLFQNSNQIKEFTVHNTTEDTLKISYISKLIGVKVKLNPSVLIPAAYGKLVISFMPKHRNYGIINDYLDFNIETSNKILPGSIELKANIVEDFSNLTKEERSNSPKISIQTKRLTLANLKPDELQTEEIEIENQGNRDLHIRNIQTYDERISITPTEFVIAAGKKESFKISVSPNLRTEKLKTTITIISNDPSQSVINFTEIGQVELPEGKISNNNITEISIEKANSLISSFQRNDDLMILDVRTESEYRGGCIEGAVNIDFESWDFKNMLKLLDKEKTWLVYCKSGYRSKQAVNTMSEMGFVKIYHMKDGIDGWKAQRLKVNDPHK
jgi:rhodanese-related sulfurtransferase